MLHKVVGLLALSLLGACAAEPVRPNAAVSFAADVSYFDPRGCAETRNVRAADAQQRALAWRTSVLRVCVYTSQVRASCVLERGAVVCKRLPPGVTADDARLLLDTTDRSFLARTIVDGSPLAPHDQACRASDAEAGLDTGVTYGDADALERLLAWSAP